MTSESSVEMMEEHSGDWMCGVCDEVMHEKTPGIICLTCRNYVHLTPHVPNCSGLSRKQSSRRKGTFKCTKCKSKKTKKKCSRKDEETEETHSSSDEESADETADTVADDVEETDDALADSTKETVDPPADSTEQTDDEFTDDDDMEEIDETPADCDKDDDNNNKTDPTSTHHVAPQPTEGISTDYVLMI